MVRSQEETSNLRTPGQGKRDRQDKGLQLWYPATGQKQEADPKCKAKVKYQRQYQWKSQEQESGKQKQIKVQKEDQ